MLEMQRSPPVGRPAPLRALHAEEVAEPVARHHDLADDLAGVRLRTSRCVPVWQNEQVSVQPTWLDTHRVPRSDSGM